MKLLFLGDILIRKGKKLSLCKSLSDLFAAHDVVCCNLEAPLKNKFSKEIKKAGPSIHQPNDAIDQLLGLGVNLFCLSNNHIMDYGETGLEETMSKLSGVDAIGAGFSREGIYSPHVVKDESGKSVAIFNVSEWGFGVSDSIKKAVGYSWIHDKLFEEQFQKAVAINDYVIVTVHAGVENISYPLDSWRDVYRRLIDKGADLVLAHHPHVIQGKETYRNKEIYYSLGNFCFDFGSNEKKHLESIALSVELGENHEIKPYFTENTSDGVILKDDCLMLWQELCEKLTLPNYDVFSQNICVDLWENRYHIFYAKAFNSLNSWNAISIAKTIKRLLLKQPTDKLLLEHNLKIESHFYALCEYRKSMYTME